MNEKSILILERQFFSNKAISNLQRLGSVKYFDEQSTFSHREIQIIVCRLGLKLDSAFLDNFPSLEIICSPTTGLNHIDHDYCTEKAIKIISLKGETEFLKEIPATAEYTWALILNLSRKIPWASQSVINNSEWNRNKFRGNDLKGKYLGIVGCGRVGRLVAHFARAFGMKVLGFDNSDTAIKSGDEIIQFLSLPEVLEKSDYVTVHIDFKEENRNFIDKNLFKQMKSGSYFINTSRGEVINDKDLLEALDQGQIQGAALDVLEAENNFPNKKHLALINYAKKNHNLILTPHLGGCTQESMELTEEFIVEKLLEYLDKTPKVL